ncbi:MAG TPA: ABC transporter substrate-binding protein [Xanthobacteraceae bacterium]|jgi:NitT/TauT family transport system substrate-binding protein|nr:ABC transporter substrate-binding protein [Xanthobacteraceae bacterium]
MTPMAQSRRRFLAAAAAAAAAGLIGPSRSFGQEPPPETTIIRLAKNRTLCIAPQYVVEDLLLLEGFTEVHYVTSDAGAGQSKALARGEIDFTLQFSPSTLIPIDAGERITIIAGIHVGCFELFGSNGIRSIASLKGKTVAIPELGTSPHLFLSTMAAHVGLDPAKDIRWITSTSIPPMELFAQGKVDAFLGFPPDPQELRARNIGHVIVNSSVDRPWSQYFCCMLGGNRDFIGKNPVATKRVLRAMLKATDFCVNNPATAARRMVDGGFAARYDYALQTLREVPYNKWRDYDPEDTIRFYSLRLREAGFMRSAPNKIIADGTDWRFFNELKRELKG